MFLILILNFIFSSARTGKHTISNKLLEVVVRILVVIYSCCCCNIGLQNFITFSCCSLLGLVPKKVMGEAHSSFLRKDLRFVWFLQIGGGFIPSKHH